MTTRQEVTLKSLGALVAVFLATSCVRTLAQPVKALVDPGVRGGAAGAGNPLQGLTADESAFFKDGLARFADIEAVTGGDNNGLGSRFNSNQCLSCHSQPGAGGSSPAQNPLVGVATLNGAKNVASWFVTQNGPVREARFKRNPDGTNDGGVHALFVITGRSDAQGCNIAQPDFAPVKDPFASKGVTTSFHLNTTPAGPLETYFGNAGLATSFFGIVPPPPAIPRGRGNPIPREPGPPGRRR